MPILSPRHKIAYFPVPKAANTSLKLAMYALEHEREFKRSETERHIHIALPATRFRNRDMKPLGEYWKFAVIRDPIARIISAYNNRIGPWNKRLEARLADPAQRELLLADGILPQQPTLIEFCLRIEAYRRALQTIRLHTDPTESFLGPDIGKLDRIYPIEDMKLLTQELSQRIGQPFVVPKSNSSQSVDTTMNAAATDALMEFTAPDYAYLAQYYTPKSPQTLP